MKQKIRVTAVVEREREACVCAFCGRGDTAPVEKTVASLAEAGEFLQREVMYGMKAPAGWHHIAPCGDQVVRADIMCDVCTDAMRKAFASKRVIREAAPTQAPTAPKPKGNWDMDKYVNGED